MTPSPLTVDNEGPLNQIAATLRLERRRRGLTQAEFAAFLGITRAYLIDLEAGRPTKQLTRLADALALLGMDLKAVKRR